MHRAITALARGFAWLGGACLLAMIVMTCASILGRSINGALHSDWMQAALPGLAQTLLATGVGPIQGAFELVEVGMAFVVFAFLPLCQLHGAHAQVDLATRRLRPGADRVLTAVIAVVFAAVLILFAWQLTLGGLSKFRSGQTTLLLQFPIWWSYAASGLAAWAAAVVGAYMGGQALRSLWGHGTSDAGPPP